MSLHKRIFPRHEELTASLQSHGLEHDTPSQVADTFRLGWQAALALSPAQCDPERPGCGVTTHCDGACHAQARPSFADAWAKKGYQYSQSNVEKVRLGWDMALTAFGVTPEPTRFCNKCGYFGADELHQRPNGTGQCDYCSIGYVKAPGT